MKYSARFAIRRSHALGVMGLWVHGQWPVTDVSIVITHLVGQVCKAMSLDEKVLEESSCSAFWKAFVFERIYK
jgi:hypothetical protein